MPEQLITSEQLAREFGLTVQTIARWRVECVGPDWISVGRRIRYRRSDIDAWLSQRVRGSVSRVADDVDIRVANG